MEARIEDIPSPGGLPMSERNITEAYEASIRRRGEKHISQPQESIEDHANPTPEVWHSSVLHDPKSRHTVNAPTRAAAIQSMQQTHGNRAVQRFVQRTSASQAYMPVQREHHHEPGLLDSLFGLNPDRSFVRAGLEGLLGPDSPAHIQEGDSDWTKLGRAGYSAVAGLGAPFAIAGGEILDKINHPSEFLLGPFAGPF
jgi:hypothetical protein